MTRQSQSGCYSDTPRPSLLPCHSPFDGLYSFPARIGIAALQTLTMLGHSHAACALALNNADTAQLRQMSCDRALAPGHARNDGPHSSPARVVVLQPLAGVPVCGLRLGAVRW